MLQSNSVVFAWLHGQPHGPDQDSDGDSRTTSSSDLALGSMQALQPPVVAVEFGQLAGDGKDHPLADVDHPVGGGLQCAP